MSAPASWRSASASGRAPAKVTEPSFPPFWRVHRRRAAAQTNTYNTVFADREPREKLVGIGKNVDYQNGVFFCTWPSPAAESRRTILFLR